MKPFLRLLLPFMLLSARAGEEPTPPVPTFSEVNAALGVELFADENLWDDPTAEVAKRLKMPEESKTTVDRSFRLYPIPAFKILGAHPWSISLLGTPEHATRLSLVYANKGDFGGVGLLSGAAQSARGSTRSALNRERNDLVQNLPGAIRQDADTIETGLRALLGPPAPDRTGVIGKTTEKAKRWDWKGHALLLVLEPGNYVALRVVPTDEVGRTGTDRVHDTELRQQLKERIEHRPNGDVILSDIPMVDQGPKGFCVPATMERLLRYLGIPADMYVLAMIGQTSVGGGTSTDTMTSAIAAAVAAEGRRMEKFTPLLRPSHIARAIDDGLPIIWSIYTSEALEEGLTQRSKQRLQTSDPKLWKVILKNWRKSLGRFAVNKQSGHACLIVGYNKETDELAISDSWGPDFRERWISVEEADAITTGDLRIINF